MPGPVTVTAAPAAVNTAVARVFSDVRRVTRPRAVPASSSRTVVSAMTLPRPTTRWSALSCHKDLTVHGVGEDDGAWVQGSEPLLSRLVGNLIDNAIGHNHRGGWIRVATEADGSTAQLVVETGGRLLDRQQVAQLAQPFRRLGADRTSTGGGSGLGLSIVAAIAAAHGGSLDLYARAEGGLRVGVSLPLAARTAGVPA
ncbi:histidine kinase/DNA gyrase B/HSP90-like ATPase [Kitasatospora atroaurantiaca]|uniref:histidine kinase n=1 Tax=Kitasatospora atroaurantiaca TaxID=285545 RepID=A0A561EXM8_9ACTN|nr:histidine kinase/DNA gyrase B/HSP90-like ATPase [Kitasatospora atroaurantiaca]